MPGEKGIEHCNVTALNGPHHPSVLSLPVNRPLGKLAKLIRMLPEAALRNRIRNLVCRSRTCRNDASAHLRFGGMTLDPGNPKRGWAPVLQNTEE